MYRENADSLGALVSEHPFARSWIVRLQTLSGALILLGVGLAGWMTDGFSPHNQTSFRKTTEQWCVSLGLGGFFLATGLFCAGLVLVGRSTRARVYEEGLVYESPGRVATLRWAEIISLWIEPLRNGYFRYSLCDRGGRRISIAWRLAHVRDVGQRIERELMAHKLPSLREAHERGETLAFGAIQVTSAGLLRGKREIAWSAISAVRIDNGFVSVWEPTASAPWMDVRIGELPNLEILLAIVGQHVRVAR